jgi:hypothetical protein
VRQQNRRPRHTHRRSSLLRNLLPLPELQEEDRESAVCQDFSRHILHEQSRVPYGKAAEKVESSRAGEGAREGRVAYDDGKVAARPAT